MDEIELIDAETLYYEALSQQKMLIEGLLSRGLAILSGDAKIGKSWMVLWFCLQISKGEPIWGIPTSKCDVVYLALEDSKARIQQRMQELTDDPPDNLHYGFSCGKLGAELESQIRTVISKYPALGILFIDTLQMVREGSSAKTNLYAQDYKDLSALKQLADEHGICIFLVHHNRKEKDSGNVFNDMSGSMGISGVADTCMVLQKDNRFGNTATLSITGRDVEERQLKLVMDKNVWQVTEEITSEKLRRQAIPEFMFRVAEMLLREQSFGGSMTELLQHLGIADLKPNVASRYLTQYYGEVLEPLRMGFSISRKSAGRLVGLWMDVDPDDYDGPERSEIYASLFPERAKHDGQLSLPAAASLPSQPSLGKEPEQA
ncbi:MAG: AAA family ATPase [Firmicutes bacterium]|nr:AAA family ATPase [Lachnospiraceae bacterium]MBQ7058295.1 AAA family ATPase [Bacillota bacterium]